MPILVRDYMTPSPHTVGGDQPLAVAHAFMRENGIRHLPVLHGGKLVGVVSQRDLYFLETLAGVDPNTVKVEEAMTAEPFTVAPNDDLRSVAAEMAKHRYGTAIVCDPSGLVRGIFTTTDALRALAG
ncbi:MAG: CBS domain-containing protein [Polyangiales bacterium]